MDPILTTNAVPNGQQQPIRSQDEAQPGNGAMVTSDFETFLRLLTTQLENQDPLNPMESSEFAVQLATFSGVEQQVQTNDLLRSLVGQSGSSELAGYARWVGMDVRSPATYYFDGTSLELSPPQIPGADRAILSVRNLDGAEIGMMEIPNDGSPVAWLGTGTNGEPLPAGSYRFSVDGYSGQERVSSSPLESYGRVGEIQNDAAGVILVLENGTKILASTVTGIREPSEN